MDQNVKRVHFVGIGGVGMGSFAVALSDAGYEVTGSDGALYEPMKSVLAQAKITLFEGFAPQTLEKIRPDLVIIGNVVRRDNPEASAWLRSGARFMSFPEAVRFFLIQDKKAIVCAGTHGKTTTTSWISFLLDNLGLKPSYLIGGVPKDLPKGCRLSASEWFVGEGDEYDSAFFDKGPKFLHYNPHFLVLTNIEFDHADIYKDLAHVQASFEKLIALLPGDGLCIARYDDKTVMEVVSGALCPVQTFGTGPGAMWRIGRTEEDEEGMRFEVIYRNRSAGEFRTPMFGEHNLLNILSGIVCAINMGISMDKVRPIVERFHGAKRRQEVLAKEPILLIDDFAHHPTEVKATLSAVRKRYPSRRIWALFEPRSATARRNVHQKEYAEAFSAADQICISQPYRHQELKEEERFSADALCEHLRSQGKEARSFPNAQKILDHFIQSRADKDIVVVMSNGEFDKIQQKILAAVS